jgi:hypothetical protein
VDVCKNNFTADKNCLHERVEDKTRDMLLNQLTLISVFYSLAESFVKSPQTFDVDNLLSLQLGTHICVRACLRVHE